MDQLMESLLQLYEGGIETLALSLFLTTTLPMYTNDYIGGQECSEEG